MNSKQFAAELKMLLSTASKENKYETVFNFQDGKLEMLSSTGFCLTRIIEKVDCEINGNFLIFFDSLNDFYKNVKEISKSYPSLKGEIKFKLRPQQDRKVVIIEVGPEENCTASLICRQEDDAKLYKLFNAFIVEPGKYNWAVNVDELDKFLPKFRKESRHDIPYPLVTLDSLVGISYKKRYEGYFTKDKNKENDVAYIYQNEIKFPENHKETEWVALDGHDLKKILSSIPAKNVNLNVLAHNRPVQITSEQIPGYISLIMSRFCDETRKEKMVVRLPSKEKVINSGGGFLIEINKPEDIKMLDSIGMERCVSGSEDGYIVEYTKDNLIEAIKQEYSGLKVEWSGKAFYENNFREDRTLPKYSTDVEIKENGILFSFLVFGKLYTF